MQALATIALVAAALLALSPAGQTLLSPGVHEGYAIVPLTTPSREPSFPTPMARKIFPDAPQAPSFGEPRDLTDIAEGPYFGEVRGIIEPIGAAGALLSRKSAIGRPNGEGGLPPRVSLLTSSHPFPLYERILDDAIAQIELAARDLNRAAAGIAMSLSRPVQEGSSRRVFTDVGTACAFCASAGSAQEFSGLTERLAGLIGSFLRD